MWNKTSQLSLTNPSDAKACQNCPIRRAYNVVADSTGNWSISIRLAVVASEICEIQKNSLKIQTYSSMSSKVNDLGANQKRICAFLLATNSNFGRISYCFRDIDAFGWKIVYSSHPSLVWLMTPPSSGAPWDISVIYTSLKVHLMGYNSVADITGLSLFV